MRLMDRVLLRGLKSRLPEGTKILALEHGKSDALGEERKVTAVLTDQALLLATTIRTKSVLTTLTRSGIGSIKVLEPNFVAINYLDHLKDIRRVVKLDLRRSGDRAGLLPQLEADRGRRTTGAT